MMSIVSILCGGLITLSAFSGFVLNISVMYILYKNGFLNPTYNSVYILALCNILGNTVQLFVSFAYLGPTSIMQKDYFEKGPQSFGTKFFSWIFLGAWYADMFIQPAVALNRFIMIIFPLYTHVFNRKKTIIYGIVTLLSGFVLAIFSDYVIPCCIAYVYYGVYSYIYFETEFNYVNTYIDLPVNSSSSFISIFFYVIIFIYVRKNNLRASKLVKKELVSRKTKEIRYAVQFAFCSIFALFAWIAFRIFPVFIPPGQLAWFTSISIFLILHCVANSLIFLCFNKEFKDKYFGRLSYKNNSNQNIPSLKEIKIIPVSKNTPRNGFPHNQ